MNSMERFENAARGLPVDRPPVWMMRQAGRTLPEYRELRERHTFWELCKTPELAADVTLQPLRRFPIDAAIIFSDILVVPRAMGQDVKFSPKISLSPAVESLSDLSNLQSPDVCKELGFVARALRIVINELGGEKPVLGFSGAPYTIATYMVEGGSSKHFEKIKAMAHKDPALLDKLLEKIGDVVAEYLAMQIEAGVSAVQLFDTWANELSPDDYERFALVPAAKVVSKLAKKGVPVIYYMNGVSAHLEASKQIGASVVGVDWRVSLRSVRERLGEKTIVQGNLDPAALFAPPDKIKEMTRNMIAQTGGTGHIVNLGHGVLPDTPLEGIAAFIDAAANWNGGNNA